MNSVILQVDESTKGLMEEIQSGITSSIEDGIRDVKSKVEAVDDNTDMILRKFKNFDGLSSSIDQLRSLAEESKKFASIVSPLQDSMAEIQQGAKANEVTLSEQKENIKLLVNGVLELCGKQDSMSNDIKSLLVELQNNIETYQQRFASKVDNSLIEIISSVNSVQNTIIEDAQKLEESIAQISASQKEFQNAYNIKETTHAEFEHNTDAKLKQLNESVEKLQATLDIVVNLVTPFWKKWK